MNLANTITMIRIGMIPLFMLAYQSYPEWMLERFSFLREVNAYGIYWAVGLFIVASSTDKLDGYIARKYNQTTNLGKLLDPLADKLLVSAALIMMVQHHVIPVWIAFVIIAREVIVSAIRIVAASKGIALAADGHGKLKMVLQIVAIVAVLLGNFPFSYVTDVSVDRLLMLAAVILTVYSGYMYVRNNYKLLQLSLE